MREPTSVAPSMWVRASYDKGGFKVYRAEAAVLPDTELHRFGDAIEAQVILLLVDFSQQFALKLFKLHFVDRAFKNGFLHALADAFARLGNAAQAFAAGDSFS